MVRAEGQEAAAAQGSGLPRQAVAALQAGGRLEAWLADLINLAALY